MSTLRLYRHDFSRRNDIFAPYCHCLCRHQVKVIEIEKLLIDRENISVSTHCLTIKLFTLKLNGVKSKFENNLIPVSAHKLNNYLINSFVFSVKSGKKKQTQIHHKSKNLNQLYI